MKTENKARIALIIGCLLPTALLFAGCSLVAGGAVREGYEFARALDSKQGMSYAEAYAYCSVLAGQFSGSQDQQHLTDWVEGCMNYVSE